MSAPGLGFASSSPADRQIPNQSQLFSWPLLQGAKHTTSVSNLVLISMLTALCRFAAIHGLQSIGPPRPLAGGVRMPVTAFLVLRGLLQTMPSNMKDRLQRITAAMNAHPFTNSLNTEWWVTLGGNGGSAHQALIHPFQPAQVQTAIAYIETSAESAAVADL